MLGMNPKPYLEGQGDLVSGLIIRGISRVIMWIIGVIKLLTKSPDPPSKPYTLNLWAGEGLRFGFVSEDQSVVLTMHRARGKVSAT